VEGLLPDLSETLLHIGFWSRTKEVPQLPSRGSCIQHFRCQQIGRILLGGLPRVPSSSRFHVKTAWCHYYDKWPLNFRNLQACKRLYCRLAHSLLLYLCGQPDSYANTTVPPISASYTLSQDSHKVLHIYQATMKYSLLHIPGKYLAFSVSYYAQFQCILQYFYAWVG